MKSPSASLFLIVFALWMFACFLFFQLFEYMTWSFGLYNYILFFSGLFFLFFFVLRFIPSLRINRQMGILDERQQLGEMWNALVIEKRIEEVFLAYHSAFFKWDPEIIRPFVTDRLFGKYELEIGLLKQLKRQNTIEHPVLVNLAILSASDVGVAGQEWFNARVGKGHIRSYDVTTQEVYFEDGGEYDETWTFVNEQGVWKLDIQTNGSMPQPDVAQFVQEHGFYYDFDFGWYMSPKNSATFQTDNPEVQELVIGRYRNVIVNFYVFSFGHRKVGNKPKLMVAQALLPHTQTTSFSPAFDAYLKTLSFEVKIESVDSFLYISTLNSSRVSYADLFQVMEKVLDEMKM